MLKLKTAIHDSTCYTSHFILVTCHVSTCQVVLRNCGTVRLDLDLASLRRDAARITDLSFQSMDSLTIRFRLGRGVVVLLVAC